MRLALCMRGQCKLCRDCQGCSLVKETLGACAAAYEDCRRSESTGMCVLIAFHWPCLTQGHSVTHPGALPSAASSGTEEQWDGCTAPQEHSIHLQAGVGCNLTVTLTEHCCLQSKFCVLLEEGEAEHKCCPTV